jgi:hypothetical protein
MPFPLSEPLVHAIIIGGACYVLAPGGMLVPYEVSGFSDQAFHAVLVGGAAYIFTQYVRPSGWYTGMWLGKQRTVNNNNAPATTSPISKTVSGAPSGIDPADPNSKYFGTPTKDIDSNSHDWFSWI